VSVYLTTHVWHHSKHKGTALLLVLALADQANDEGVCWPSVQTLAHKTRLSERSVQNLLPEVLGSGEVEVLKETHGGHSPRVYRVVAPPAPARAPTPRGAKSSPLRKRRPGVQISGSRGEESGSPGVQLLPTGVQISGLGVKPVAPEPELTVREPCTEPSLTGGAAAPISASVASDRVDGSDGLGGTIEQDLTYRIQQVASDLDDPAVPACVSHARRLLLESGLEWYRFDNMAKLAWHNTKRRREDADKPRLNTPMAYFFEQLRTLTRPVEAST